MIRFLMRGALAGAVATVPMTAVFMAAEKTGLMGEIPPKHITRDLLRYAGARPMRRETRNAATMGLHFLYGAFAGAVYAWLAHRLRLPVPRIVQGIGYALGVWAMSYMGWVPALGIMRSEERHGTGWVLSNAAAHIVYGAVLGGLAGKGRRSQNRRPGPID